MTGLQPKPAQFKPPSVPALQQALAVPAAAWSAACIAPVAALRPLHSDVRGHWGVQARGGGVRDLDPATGAERAHAKRLARW